MYCYCVNSGTFPSVPRICAGTWNVGGKLPPDDLAIDDWLGISDPADIYVLGYNNLLYISPI